MFDSNVLRQLLGSLRDEFLSRTDDLRHLLFAVDDRCYFLPPEFDRRGADGFALYGHPPARMWRRLPGEAKERPLVYQELEPSPVSLYRHTFYGAPAFVRFKDLAFRVVCCLAEMPEDVYGWLIGHNVNLPPDRPYRGCQTAHLWWPRALHFIGQKAGFWVAHPAMNISAEKWSAGGYTEIPPTNFVEQAKARSENGDHICEFSYSLLNGNLFISSARAIELILLVWRGGAGQAALPGAGTPHSASGRPDALTTGERNGSPPRPETEAPAADPLTPMRDARDLFAAAARADPLPPDLHAVIVQAPDNKHHPALLPGSELPPLPVAIRDRPWLNAFFRFIRILRAARRHISGASSD